MVQTATALRPYCRSRARDYRRLVAARSRRARTPSPTSNDLDRSSWTWPTPPSHRPGTVPPSAGWPQTVRLHAVPSPPSAGTNSTAPACLPRGPDAHPPASREHPDGSVHSFFHVADQRWAKYPEALAQPRVGRPQHDEVPAWRAVTCRSGSRRRSAAASRPRQLDEPFAERTDLSARPAGGRRSCGSPKRITNSSLACRSIASRPTTEMTTLADSRASSLRAEKSSLLNRHFSCWRAEWRTYRAPPVPRPGPSAPPRGSRRRSSPDPPDGFSTGLPDSSNPSRSGRRVSGPARAPPASEGSTNPDHLAIFPFWLRHDCEFDSLDVVGLGWTGRDPTHRCGCSASACKASRNGRVAASVRKRSRSRRCVAVRRDPERRDARGDGKPSSGDAEQAIHEPARRGQLCPGISVSRRRDRPHDRANAGTLRGDADPRRQRDRESRTPPKATRCRGVLRPVPGGGRARRTHGASLDRRSRYLRAGKPLGFVEQFGLAHLPCGAVDPVHSRTGAARCRPAAASHRPWSRAARPQCPRRWFCWPRLQYPLRA